MCRCMCDFMRISMCISMCVSMCLSMCILMCVCICEIDVRLYVRLYEQIYVRPRCILVDRGLNKGNARLQYAWPLNVQLLEAANGFGSGGVCTTV